MVHVAAFPCKWLVLAILLVFSARLEAQEEKTEPVDTIPAYVRTYEKASKLVDSAKYNQAMPLLKSVIKENPDYYMAWNKMAWIYYKTDKPKELEKALAKAESISPMNYDTHKIKGIYYLEAQKYKEAKVSLDTAISIAAIDKIDDREIYYYQAKLMFIGKSYKQALAACQAALDLDAKYLDVMKLKGEIRYAMKDYLNAVKDLDEAIKLMPAEKPDYDSYRTRAKSKFMLKDFKGCINDWSVLIDADPKDEEAYTSRAAARINSGDNTAAIVDLDEAIKLNSKNPVSWCNRGVAKFANKNHVEALKDIDQAIKIKFDYAEAHFRKGIVKLFGFKDKPGACEEFEKADSLGDPTAFKMVEQYCKTN
jgi:tetratricopeptide (TPR) repeat protein